MIKELGWLYFFLNSQNPDFIEEEGFSIYKSGMYYIYINADLPTGRDNFTYAHEIAHIVLSHHLKYDVDSLTEHEHWLINREANIFASNLLMPEEWIRREINTTYISIPELGRLKEVFQVSWDAIINRLDELNIQSKIVSYRSFEKKKHIQLESRFRSENSRMNGIKIATDKNHRFLVCPFCGNKDITQDASYCKICGTYLFNYCTSLDCGRHNAWDARYCIYCGAETFLLRSGYLIARNEVLQAQKEIAAGTDRKRTDIRLVKNKAAGKGGFGA